MGIKTPAEDCINILENEVKVLLVLMTIKQPNDIGIQVHETLCLSDLTMARQL